MQAVILAAGRGTRMVELTEAVPKPMLDVGGKPLLEYKLEALPEEIDEVVILIGYHGDVIRKHFGGAWGGKRITYIEQKDLNGTAGALWYAKDVLRNRFMVMAGDDIYAREDMQHCIDERDSWTVLLQQVREMHRAGSVLVDEAGNVTGIAEGDRGTESGLANTNLFVVDTRLFDQPMVPKMADNLEFGLPQTIIVASKAVGVPLRPIFTDKWIQITSPKDLVFAAEMLKKGQKTA